MKKILISNDLASAVYGKATKVLKSKTGRDVATVYFGKIVEAVLGLIASILVGRSLGPEKLGILMSLVALANVIGCFMGYGLDVTVVKYIADARGKNAMAPYKVANDAMAIRIMFVFVVAVVVYSIRNTFIMKYMQSSASNSLVVLTLMLAASNSIFFFFQSVTRGFQLFKKNVITNTLGRLLRLMLILYYCYFGVVSVENVLLCNIVAALFIVVVDAELIRRMQTNATAEGFQPDTSSKSIKNILKYSFWMYLTAILGVLFNNMNIIMLNWYTVSTAVGLYAMAENLLRPFEFLPETLNQVFMPKVSAIETTADFTNYVRKISCLGGLMVLCMLPLFVCPEFVISIFYGDKYTGGGLVLRLLSLYLCINIFLNPLYVFAHRLNMPGIFTVSGVVALLVGFVANSQFIPLYGEVGCALTSLTVCFFSKTLLLPNIYFRAKRMLPESAAL